MFLFPDMTVKHLTMQELEAALDHLREAPKDNGVVQLIVRRPRTADREVLDRAEVDPANGLIGDLGCVRPSSRAHDRSPHHEMQLNVMNSRDTALVAQEKGRWPLAGDQVCIDMDRSKGNLPGGTQLASGSAVLV